MKHALLLTFYWPPGGGTGVHRWLRFSQFFQENGWDLTVYCPENAAWPIRDEALGAQIHPSITELKRPIFEPHAYLSKSKSGNGGGVIRNEKSGILSRLIVWIRGNLFIPDARMFWIRPSVRFLTTYLRENPEITTIISSGPPHSMHIIARRLKKKFPHLKWVADFRDPWTEIDFYSDLNIGERADRKHRKLEKAVLTEADKVISVSQACADGLAAIGKRSVEVVTNGFIFPSFDPKKVKLDSQFTIAHFGSMPMGRNPEVLWKALEIIVREDTSFAKKLSIRLYGSVDFEVFNRIEHYGLTRFVSHISNVSHGESIALQQSTAVLLLVGNNTGNVKGILTGKVFEYMGAKRPIFTVGEAESNLESVIKETQSGKFVDFDDTEMAVLVLKDWFEQFENERLYSYPVGLEKYASDVIIKQLLDEL